jgi:hypothetical protein
MLLREGNKYTGQRSVYLDMFKLSFFATFKSAWIVTVRRSGAALDYPVRDIGAIIDALVACAHHGANDSQLHLC